MARTGKAATRPGKASIRVVSWSMPWLLSVILPWLPALAAAGEPAPARAAAAPLHVPSPDWRDQVIYFAMLDRFDDGDPSNNDQGVGEYDPADGSRYSGGDLAGVKRRLDYIQDLGATALWLTPPVANQWLNPDRSFSGYHGYWATDFSRVDAHYGTLAAYQALSRALHGRGMYLVQDVVVNHTADYLQCVAPAPHEPGRHCEPRSDARGRSAPLQAPFDRNDPRDPAQRVASIYHWTPPISDFGQRVQELDYQLADLDDLDTENPVVRQVLRESYATWIRDVGVDAFRVDTAFHVPAEFFRDFLHSEDVEAPGMIRVATSTGRGGFLAFGEGFGTDRAFDDTRARKLDAYMRTSGGLPSMINFPLYGTLGDVFARGRPTSELAHRIESMMAMHADPWRMPSFVDNHDVDRFLAGGDEAGLKQALLAMLTLPGIPVIYYGTEQGFAAQRPSMFASGHGSGGRDHFDTHAPLYRYLQRAIALRRGDTLFSRGTPTVLAHNPARSGAIAWRIDGTNDDGEEAIALVVLNSADTPMLLDRLDTSLPAGGTLRGVFAIEDDAADLSVGEGGRLTLVLPPRSGQVWKMASNVGQPGTNRAKKDVPSSTPPRGRRAADCEHAVPMPKEAIAPCQTTAGLGSMDLALPGSSTAQAEAVSVATADFDISGHAPGLDSLRLVVDGDLGNAQKVRIDADGRWQARVRVDDMIDPSLEHRVVAFDPAAGETLAARTFRVDLDWTPSADAVDPPGDDHGPDRRYIYPTDPGWRELRPADIRRVRTWSASGALRIEITMAGISDAWHPTHGFDHVAFTAYLSFPDGSDGATAMPQQHAILPDGRQWHYRWRAHGWSNVLTRASGADASNEGEAITPVPTIRTDRDARTVTVTFPASALGSPDNLNGAILHLNTWDYDGGYRALAPQAGPMTFGGGEPSGARIMDAIDIELRADAGHRGATGDP